MGHNNILIKAKSIFTGRISLLVAAISCILGVVLLTSLSNRLIVDVQTKSALDAARRTVQTITTAKLYYTRTIIPIVSEAGLNVAHDYHSKLGTVPIPATMGSELATAVSKQRDDLQISVFSNYKFRNSKSSLPLDVFQKDALQFMKEGNRREYWTVENTGTESVLRFASAIVMKKGCVECHNTSPDSPKRDWKVGDIRGATSVYSPLKMAAIGDSSSVRVMQIMAVFILTLVIAILCCSFAIRRAELNRVAAKIAKKRERAMRDIALTDHLTGLPNRRALDEFLKGIVDPKSAPTGFQPAIFHIDLDSFKQINDNHGHAAGDQVLRRIGQVLKDHTPEGGLAARVGGDEFVIYTNLPLEDERVEELAKQIIQDLKEPVEFSGDTHRIGASIGIAGLDHNDPDQSLVQADIAMYDAKQTGRNKYQFFSSAMQDKKVNYNKLSGEVITALDDGQFFPVYQPQYDALTRKLTGIEALARWQHPKRGILPPAGFMSIVNDLQLDADLDRQIMRMALDDRARWRNAGLTVPRLSVNMSFGRLSDPNLIATLKADNVPAGVLSVELVESIFLDNASSDFAWSLDTMRELGIGIELDDFGTGHTSIAAVSLIRPDCIKIDKSLTLNILTDGQQHSLMQSLVEIGSFFDVRVVAEGVETLAHADVLRDLGCDALQGYGLAKPMTSGKLIEFMKLKLKTAS